MVHSPFILLYVFAVQFLDEGVGYYLLQEPRLFPNSILSFGSVGCLLGRLAHLTDQFLRSSPCGMQSESMPAWPFPRIGSGVLVVV